MVHPTTSIGNAQAKNSLESAKTEEFPTTLYLWGNFNLHYYILGEYLYITFTYYI